MGRDGQGCSIFRHDKYREKEVSYRDINVFPASYQFFAPRRSGLSTNLLDLNFHVIQRCRQHVPLGFNAAVINNRNITQRKWGICRGSWERTHSLPDWADKPLPQIWNGRSIPPPIIAVGLLLNIPPLHASLTYLIEPHLSQMTLGMSHLTH